MKTLAACLSSLHLLVFPCVAQDKQSYEVKVASLTLPDGSDGLIHWRQGDTPTIPLQLSTRYFSGSLKLNNNVIQFFKEPVLAVTDKEQAPSPLITLKIPSGQKLTYIVLTHYLTEERQVSYRATLLNSADWKVGSMKLFNACSEPLGIAAGPKKMQLSQGKSVDFYAAEWKETFPVKIFRLEPELKTIFSSSWRVTPGRRELCYVANNNNALMLRSLIDLGAVPTEIAPVP